MFRSALTAIVLGAVVVEAGCSSAPKKAQAYPSQPLVHAKQIIDEAAPPGTYPPVDRITADSLATALCAPAAVSRRVAEIGLPATPRPLNVLVLSGGGQYATFASGILVGWTATGCRPAFDVVTGVSSGAMTAVFAYLGPKYDPVIQRLSNTVQTSDIYRLQPVRNLLFHDSLASSRPLQKMIDVEINNECIEDIRAAHQLGRRLFVGTMNQRTRRLVIWDLGAIACSGRPDADQLVRKILLATSSIPGLLPPVLLDVEVNGVHYCEEHADGGAVSQGFVRFGPENPPPDPARPCDKWLAGSNLYAIAGGKLYADSVEGRMRMLKRTTSTISGTLYALYRADLWRIYTICAASGMKFHHTAIPQEMKVDKPSTEFDPQTMKELFAAGYDMATRGIAWRLTPPGYDPGEEDTPRAGFRFIVPGNQ